jgi:hypothetical protein
MTLAERRPMLRLASLFLLSGCVGDLVELTPGPLTGSTSDMAQASTGGTGGTTGGGTTAGGGSADLAVAAPHFNPTIQADIDALGCSAASCHGGAQTPVLKRMPIAAADITTNYDDFKAEAMNGAQSNILVKNLAGSGVTHTGGSSFASTSDPIYQRWLAWINAGTPE